MASDKAKKIDLGTDVKTSPALASRAGGAVLPPARRKIVLDRIVVRDRLRPRDPSAVANLAVSMAENGQITPVMVRPVRMDGDDVWFELVVGGHRYDAALLNGWTHIDAMIQELSDAQALMMEIDENLVRRDLTPYERALFINARLSAWAELHPERIAEGKLDRVDPITAPLAPKRGRPRNSDKLSQFLGDTPPSMGFSAETALDLGVDRRTVERALAVARGLAPAVHAKVSGSPLGKNEGLLRQIAGVGDPAEQLRIVEALTDGRTTKFADAQVYAAGKTPTKAPERPVDETVKALKKVWKAAPKTHRDAMLHWLSGEALPTGWNLVKGGADG
jgi:ParB family transcriptional regulator, chromosome partitioning protein